MTGPDLFSEINVPPETAEIVDRAHARADDRATSHAAAASVTDLTKKQEAVRDCLATFGQEGAPDVEMIERYKRLRWAKEWPVQSDSGLRTRRNELFLKGAVEDIGTRVISRRTHTVWRLV